MSGGSVSGSIRVTLLCILLSPSWTSLSMADGQIGPALTRLLASGPPPAPVTAGVFFRDKDEGSFSDIHGIVSDRALSRRAKVQGRVQPLDYSDIHLKEEYVTRVSRHVVRIKQRSRWFNGVSVVVYPDSIPTLLSYPFIREIELVARHERGQLIEAGNSNPDSTPQFPSVTATAIDYGLSFDQLNQIGVPAVHDSGNFAENVMIGVFDNGFRLLHHEAFDSMNIVATYDFVDKKTSVVPNNPSPSFGSHGVNSLSTIGGYKPGQLVGPAFRAAFVLARTENDSSETPIEEDNWVAAIEWADSIGVDITSTSLIYRGYDSPYQSWTWEDMDGNSTMITRAADMAVAKGIIVVNSAGNFGGATVPGQNTLGAPADGDSVLTVGAVDASGERTTFSSVGPTTAIPSRTKPDVMARGVLVRAASATDPTGYIGTFQGTSAACPLAAGVAALVLNRFPDSEPVTVMNALRQTAGNASSPNNLTGWGILNASAAISYMEGNPPQPPPEASPILLQNFPNPFNTTTSIRFGLPAPSDVRLEVFDVLGQSVRVLRNGTMAEGWHEVTWDTRDREGVPVASGVYVYRLSVDPGNGRQISDTKGILVR